MAFTRFFFTNRPGHPSLNGLGTFGPQHPAQSQWGAWPAPDNYGGGNPSGKHFYFDGVGSMRNYAMTQDPGVLGATDGKIISSTGTVVGAPTFTRWLGSNFGASYLSGGTPTYGWAIGFFPWARFSFPMRGIGTVYAANAINQSTSASATNPWMLALAHRGRNGSDMGPNRTSSWVWFPHCYVYRPSTASIVGWVQVSSFNYDVIGGIAYGDWNAWKEAVPGSTTLRYPYQSHWGGNVTGVQDGDLFVWEMFQIVEWNYYMSGGVPAGGTFYATHDLEIQGPRIVGDSNAAPGLTYGANGYPNFASNYVWANEVVLEGAYPRRPQASVGF